LLRAWVDGEFEMVVSETLLGELERALAYPKVRTRVAPDRALAFVDLVRSAGAPHDDPARPASRSPDPGDDYLIALAAASSSVLVSGDRHLLELSPGLPIYSAAAYLKLIEESRRRAP